MNPLEKERAYWTGKSGMSVYVCDIFDGTDKTPAITISLGYLSSVRTITGETNYHWRVLRSPQHCWDLRTQVMRHGTTTTLQEAKNQVVNSCWQDFCHDSAVKPPGFTLADLMTIARDDAIAIILSEINRPFALDQERLKAYLLLPPEAIEKNLIDEAFDFERVAMQFKTHNTTFRYLLEVFKLRAAM